LIMVFIQLFILQLKKLKINSPTNCLNIFKSNNYLGLIVFLGLLIGKI
jgi:4-hydroxybenzoate polyprenyltransferase